MGKITECPWGRFEVLAEAPGHKIKRIVVEPDGRLSLQLHRHRDEHWFVISGKGVASIGGKRKFLSQGKSIDIPRRMKHHVHNTSGEDLVILEIQTGEYCGDDDIERFEDKYGRV